MRVLVTGFEPFGGESVNPTSLLVEHVNSCQLKIPVDLDVRGLILPVTFEDSFDRLKNEIREFDPKVILSFGQAGGRDAINFERVAVNCIDAKIPDNKGWHPRDLPIVAGGQEAYFSSLPIRELSDALIDARIPSRISNSAGTYVCNFLFYKLMQFTEYSTRRAGFIHVPFLPEQVQTKTPMPLSMELETILRALELILKRLSRLTAG